MTIVFWSKLWLFTPVFRRGAGGGEIHDINEALLKYIVTTFVVKGL